MNLIESIRRNLIYLLLSLPIVIILYELFMMFAIGNRGWSMLATGQIILVPLMGLLLSQLYSLDNSMLWNGVFILIAFTPLIILTAVLYDKSKNNIDK